MHAFSVVAVRASLERLSPSSTTKATRRSTLITRCTAGRSASDCDITMRNHGASIPTPSIFGFRSS